MVEKYTFTGFSSPNTTPVPDVLFDELMPRLTDIELRVLLYIMRRTFGFKKNADDISLKQMVEGITTRNGRALDGGCGLSRPSVTKAVRLLAEKNIIQATANYSDTKGYQATTYALVFATDTPSQRGYDGYRNGVTIPHRNPVAIQETVLQKTDKQEEILSKDTPIVDKFVDNLSSSHVVVLVPQIAAIMEDFSKEMNDFDHTASNITQATRLYRQSGCSLDQYFTTLYAARTKTRKATGVSNRMPFFFEVLRQEIELRAETRQ